MPVSVQREQANVFRLELSGLLLKSEFDAGQRRLTEEIARLGAVKLLVVLESFEGWEPNAPWNDLSFYARYGDAIERIAIVGDPRWRDLTMMFASADLRRAPVEFFGEQDGAKARAWLLRDG